MALGAVEVSRPRIWLLAFPRWLLEEANVAEADLQAFAIGTLTKLTIATRRDVDDFLLPEDHEVVREELASAVALEEKREEQAQQQKLSSKTQVKATSQKRPMWHERHAQIFDKQGMDWWNPDVPSPETLAAHPGIVRMSERQRELCAMLGIKFPDARRCLKDVSQSSQRRNQVRHNHSDCVTPKGLLYVTHRARCATGLEALLLQGIHYGPLQPKVTEVGLRSHQLKDLAGNAFNAHCNAAMHVVAQCCLAKLHMCKRSAMISRSRTLRMASFGDLLDFPQAQGDESDEDSTLE